MPSTATAWHVAVTGSLAELTVTQTFHNDASYALGATWSLPLGPGAFVDSLRITFGDQVIEGRVLPREAVEELYTRARAEERVARLAGSDATTFRQHIRTIGPGETVTVVASFVEPVPFREGAYELALPLDAPPGLTADAQPGEGTFVDGYADVDLDVDVRAGVPIVHAESPTDPIAFAIDGDHLTGAARGLPPTHVLRVRWASTTDTIQLGLLTSPEHALLAIEPPRTSAYPGRAPREVVWVVDMGIDDAHLGLVKRALKAALAAMNPDDTFAIVTSDHARTGPFARPVPATPENLSIAAQYVDSLPRSYSYDAPRALRAALGLRRDRNRARTVTFLAAARLDPQYALMYPVSRHPRVTFNAVATGPDASDERIDELARRGHGVASHFVRDEAADAFVRRIVDVLDPAVLRTITVDWGGGSVEAYPAALPDLHVGIPVQVVAHRSGATGPVRVSGTMGAGTFTQVVEPEPVAVARPLETTWARAHVADLEQQVAAGTLADAAPAIRETGLRWRIPTRETHFVALLTRPEAWDGKLVVQEASGFEREFLSRIPSGRCVDGWSTVHRTEADPPGFPFDHDPALPTAGAFAEPPTLGRPLLLDPSTIDLKGNDLTLDVEAGAGGFAGGHTAWLQASPSGPIVKDRVWSAADLHFWSLADRGVSVDTQTVTLHVRAEPSSTQHFSLLASADPTTVLAGDTSTTYGGAAVGLAWTSLLPADHTLDTWASASRRAGYGGDRSAFEAGTRLTLRQLKTVGTHDVSAGVTVDGLGWAGATTQDHTLLTTAFVEDGWQWETFHADARLAGGVLSDGTLLPSPGLGFAWDPWGDDRTRIHGGASRNWDTDTLQIGVHDATGLPSRADTASLGITRTLLRDVSAGLEASFRSDHLAFVIPSDAAAIDTIGGAPWVDQRAVAVEASIAKDDSDRWFASIHWRWTALVDADPALLSDPRAPWVPRFLDPWHADAVRAELGVRLPTVPYDFTLRTVAGWASPIDPSASAWWLGAREHVGVALTQRVPLRLGDLFFMAWGTWALRDPDTAVLPLPVLAADPSVPDLGSQAPFQAEGGLEYRW